MAVDLIIFTGIVVVLSMLGAALVMWLLFHAILEKLGAILARHDEQVSSIVREAFTHLSSKDVKATAEALAIQERAVVEKEMMKAHMAQTMKFKPNGGRIEPAKVEPDLELITPDNIDDIFDSLKR